MFYKNNLKSFKVLFIIFITIALIIIGFYCFQLITENAEKSKFEKLNLNTKSVYDDLRSVNPTETIAYKAICGANYNGDWPTGDFTCITSISFKKIIHSVQELNKYNDSFIKTIGSSQVWKNTSSPLEATPDFGKNFNVSVASKKYANKATGIICNYEVSLDQTKSNTNYQFNNDQLGYKITSGDGQLQIDLGCGEKSDNSWYTKAKDISTVVY